MTWEHIGTAVGVIQGVVVLLLLVVQLGRWTGKGESSTRNLASQLKAQGAAITEVQNLVVKKVDLGACDQRFGLIGQQVDQMVTREHCDTLHKQMALDLTRTEKVAEQAATAAQQVATTAAVISQQLKGLTDTLADNTKRLGRIEAALMKVKNGNGNGDV